MNLNHPDQAETPVELTEALVRACQRGDPDAQKCLYRARWQRVCRLVARIAGWQDAEDVAQQVFLKVFQTIGQFSGRSRFDTWLYRIAVNESLQYVRRVKRWRRDGLALQGNMEPSSDDSPEAGFDQRELLEQALESLEPEFRAVFLLKEVEGLSYCEIAEALGIPEGTVGSRLNQARRTLRQRLKDLGYEA